MGCIHKREYKLYFYMSFIFKSIEHIRNTNLNLSISRFIFKGVKDPYYQVDIYLTGLYYNLYHIFHLKTLKFSNILQRFGHNNLDHIVDLN